jgi:uncharacterized protein YkuJ
MTQDQIVNNYISKLEIDIETLNKVIDRLKYENGLIAPIGLFRVNEDVEIKEFNDEDINIKSQYIYKDDILKVVSIRFTNKNKYFVVSSIKDGKKYLLEVIDIYKIIKID